MKRLLLAACMMGALALGIHAQQPASNKADQAQHAEPAGGAPKAGEPVQHEETEGRIVLWKWVNFVILVGGLGYLAAKNLPAYFRSRNEEIQRGIADAAKLKREAEARAAKMEARLGRLKEEVEGIRKAAHDQMSKESDRIRQETAQHLARVQQQGEQEIAALSNHAVRDLKTYAAQLAIDLAEQRVRSRMTPEVQNHLVEGFVADLDRPGMAKEAGQ